mmetsp:Transcript_9743/g.21428  ORF Transcript_9743/g.21428 Transcript_9743/m.21428 type:complete len:87 (-) Transcript_9743:209-469(-)
MWIEWPSRRVSFLVSLSARQDLPEEKGLLPCGRRAATSPAARAERRRSIGGLGRAGGAGAEAGNTRRDPPPQHSHVALRHRQELVR